jgi:hypothetical protein
LRDVGEHSQVSGFRVYGFMFAEKPEFSSEKPSDSSKKWVGA